LFFADPGGIGSAFHRAEDGEKQKGKALKNYFSVRHKVHVKIHRKGKPLISSKYFEPFSSAFSAPFF